MFDSILRRFMDEAPVCVAVRATLQRLLRPEWLDEVFRREAREQYESKLLFSTLVELVGQVVAGARRSVNEAYQHAQSISVSVSAVYDKLKRMEPGISAALVRDSARETAAVLEHLDLPSSPIDGIEVRIVDGNHLAATEHRLEELRHTRSGPLPGQALVVLDPRRKLMLDVIPCEDAYAQERSLVPQLLERVKPGELWISDRNFCTTVTLTGISRRQAFFLIRQHQSTLRWEEAGPWKGGGRIKAGKVFEQPIRVRDPISGNWMDVRRVKLELDEPTRDGETEILLLSNLPKQVASAKKLAELYGTRWQVENAFGELTAALACEIKTLGYPRAALFAFCLALLAYNAVSLVKSAMAAEHGEQKVREEVSFYQLSREVVVTGHGMEVALPPEKWALFATMPPARFARVLRGLATRMNLKRYRKHPRGPKKKRPPRTSGRRIKHVATARILAARNAGSAGP